MVFGSVTKGMDVVKKVAHLIVLVPVLLSSIIAYQHAIYAASGGVVVYAVCILLYWTFSHAAHVSFSSSVRSTCTSLMCCIAVGYHVAVLSASASAALDTCASSFKGGCLSF